MNDLWSEVRAYNQANPYPEEDATLVTFYFGQNVAPNRVDVERRDNT